VLSLTKRRKKMKVLVPTEGSEFSNAAIEKCCKMFDESENTEIEILSVVEMVERPTDPFGAPSEYIHDLNAAALKKATDVVDQAAEEIRKDYPELGTQLTTKVVKGSPNQEIVEEAENWGADLIVMGSHGYGFWRRSLLGSVSESVVHLAPCSVLVVRGNGIKWTPRETRNEERRQ
jgi:nucleotide-binding universal stress UspA family protein